MTTDGAERVRATVIPSTPLALRDAAQNGRDPGAARRAGGNLVSRPATTFPHHAREQVESLAEAKETVNNRRFGSA
jgi:hypothetical protein